MRRISPTPTRDVSAKVRLLPASNLRSKQQAMRGFIALDKYSVRNSSRAFHSFAKLWSAHASRRRFLILSPNYAHGKWASIDIAVADSVGCAGGESDYLRNSFADFEKRAAGRDAFVHAAVLGNSRRLDCSRDCAKFLAPVAPMDAAHVADFYRCNSVNRSVGRYYYGPALASSAVLPWTSSSFTQFDQRSRPFAR